MAEAVSRAAGKLEAAVTRFGLARAIRGARAVDVGASTGGFTQTLLGHGAAHVVAIDVGHGQLVPALQKDARVTSMEGVDWKRLSLNEAPGPFDFFTVDVSFVAARNMLRGLAFRLRPGAEGVVLVKPQFELHDKQVRGGRVDDENLRRAALDKVTKKAETLGFTVVAHADSPVAGGSGTIEILAHLRFAGRPALLPAEGESRGHKPKPARATKDPMKGARTDKLTWFAVVAPGLEEVARRELAALPEATDVRGVDGGVEWRGPPSSGARANLRSRTVTRVLVRVGDVDAREFGKLRRGLARPAVGAVRAPRARRSPCARRRRSAASITRALIAETVLLGLGDTVRGVSAAPKAKQDEDGEEPVTADAPTTTRSTCAASAIGSRSASTRRASCCTGAARARRSARRRCARRSRPASSRSQSGRPRRRSSIRCAARARSRSRRRRGRSIARRASTARSRRRAGRSSPIIPSSSARCSKTPARAPRRRVRRSSSPARTAIRSSSNRRAATPRALASTRTSRSCAPTSRTRARPRRRPRPT